MIDGKAKGANFERKIAKLFSEALGIEIRRTPLSGGWARGNPNVAGDLVCVDPDPKALIFHIECKNAEGWKLESLFTDKHAWMDKWWAQTLRDCPEGKIPLLVFSRAYIPIFVALTLEDWVTPFSNIDNNGPLLHVGDLLDGKVVMKLDIFLANLHKDS